VFSRRSNINKKTYTVDYLRLSYTTAGLRRARPIQDTDFGARQLTTVPANPEVTALVAGLIQGKSTQYDRVRAIYEHFSPNNGFQYTTRTEPGDSGSAIVDFLRSKKGFCVQYAAAMAWLVRAAGIPARVAFGFTRGRSTVSGTYTMSNLNLHAWTEVFFSGIGWVPFDATPTGPVTGSAPTLWAPDLTLPNPDDSGPLPSETAPDDRPTNRPSEDAGGGNDNPVSPGGTTPAVNTWWLISAAVVVAVVFLLLAPAMRRRALRRARRTRSGRLIVIGADSSAGAVPAADPVEVTGDPAAVMVAREDAHAAWAELLDTMVDFEVPVDPAETPRATAERLSTLPALRPAGRAHTDLLAKAEERARYARTPLRPDRLDEAVSATRKAFALRASRRQRLSATLLPRSVIQRWRAAWLGRLARLVTVTGQVRDAAMSLSPRRLLTGRRATRWPSGWKP
ncbi:MAG TPA: transglutaminase domain-containing protein, partial [Micromonosporaceae bacterium]